MDTNTLTPEVAAATLASVHAGNRNLSADPKRMAVITVWDAMMCGARNYCEQEGFVTIHNMPRIGACESGTSASTRSTTGSCTRVPVWAWPAWPSSSSARRISASACPS